MRINVKPVDYKDVIAYQQLYRHEAGCQIRHDAVLVRGFAVPYLIEVDGRVGGYGVVITKHYEGRLSEFYVFPHLRESAEAMCRELIAVSKATEIAAQTNMALMSEMLEKFGNEIEWGSHLFHDAVSTELTIEKGLFRERKPGDTVGNNGEPEGDWVVDVNGVIVANGGYFTHYNPPYGDIYMETAEPFRRKGYGSYLVQELKRICYEEGKKPSARCDPTNTASHKTLERAGFRPIGKILVGKVG